MGLQGLQDVLFNKDCKMGLQDVLFNYITMNKL